MADILTKAKRSEVMARIRSRGNRDTELALARRLRAKSITGWRRHVPILGRAALLRGPNHPLPATGAQRKVGAARQHRPTVRIRPDFVFRKLRPVIFVDGCFWHGCPKHATKPKNHRAFWQRKLAENQRRDQLVNRALRKAGWRVLRIWECDLAKRPEVCVRRVERALSR